MLCMYVIPTLIQVRHGSFWKEYVPNMPYDMLIENFRMSRQTFQLFYLKLPSMNKSDTTFRKCMPLQKRIAIVHYCLKSSSEYALIAHMFGIFKATACLILQEFCKKKKKICQNLSEEYFH